MKDIVINYEGSFVNTTKRVGVLLLVLGLIASVILFFSGLENENDNAVVTAFGIFLSSFFIYVLLNAVSVI